MKLGIVIYSSDPETVWNAFWLGSLALKEGDEVTAFLLGRGAVWISDTAEINEFRVLDQMRFFLENGGTILSLDTTVRTERRADFRTISTIEDLYQVINKSDKIVTF